MNERSPDHSRDNSRTLRQTSTRPEQLIWSALRSRRPGGLKFRRQHSIGPFVTDFVCLELKLVVELDGGYHDYVYEADKERQEFLEAEGYHVARFSNEDVLRELEAVVEGIRQVAVKLRKLTE